MHRSCKCTVSNSGPRRGYQTPIAISMVLLVRYLKNSTHNKTQSDQTILLFEKVCVWIIRRYEPDKDEGTSKIIRWRHMLGEWVTVLTNKIAAWLQRTRIHQFVSTVTRSTFSVLWIEHISLGTDAWVLDVSKVLDRVNFTSEQDLLNSWESIFGDSTKRWTLFGGSSQVRLCPIHQGVLHLSARS